MRLLRATLKTDLYEISIFRINRNTCKIELTLRGQEMEQYEDEENHEEHFWSAEERPNQILQELGGSVFFPTFRRIEGGFTLSATIAPPTLRASVNSPARRNAVEEGLLLLSRKLTN